VSMKRRSNRNFENADSKWNQRVTRIVNVNNHTCHDKKRFSVYVHQASIGLNHDTTRDSLTCGRARSSAALAVRKLQTSLESPLSRYLISRRGNYKNNSDLYLTAWVRTDRARRYFVRSSLRKRGPINLGEEWFCFH